MLPPLSFFEAGQRPGAWSLEVSVMVGRGGRKLSLAVVGA